MTNAEKHKSARAKRLKIKKSKDTKGNNKPRRYSRSLGEVIGHPRTKTPLIEDF
jgi:hypothetical protein